MKNMKYLVCFITVFISYFGMAQVGVSTITPNAAAELDVSSPGNNGGVLIPTISDAEMKAIVNPANGLFIYNTDKQKFMYNIGTAGVPNWTIMGELARMTGAQISAILAPIAGDLRYNTDTNTVWYFDGTYWQELDNDVAP